MRWSSRRDGATTVFDDTVINNDMIVVEPIITSFVPTRDGRCGCGGKLGFRCATDSTGEIYCFRCHAVSARIDLSTRVHR
jgi:hypothetical protein